MVDLQYLIVWQDEASSAIGDNASMFLLTALEKSGIEEQKKLKNRHVADLILPWP